VVEATVAAADPTPVAEAAAVAAGAEVAAEHPEAEGNPKIS